MASSTPVATKLAALAAIVPSSTLMLSLHTSSYTPAATYSATNEVAGTGYTAGGKTLSGVTTTTSGTTAFADASDVAWTGATITARYGVIYDTAASNRVVAILDFGSDQAVVSGTLTVQFPAPDAANAVLRIG